MINLIKQLFKFGIVGFLAFLIDYGIFTLFVLLDVNYLVAQIISFIVSVTFNCWASLKFVFSNDGNYKKNFIIFVILSLVGLIFNELILYIGVDKLNYNELIVKVFSTFIVMIFNFVTRKIIIEK